MTILKTALSVSFSLSFSLALAVLACDPAAAQTAPAPVAAPPAPVAAPPAAIPTPAAAMPAPVAAAPATTIPSAATPVTPPEASADSAAKKAPAAPTFYTYKHKEGEYIVDLPDAPTANSIWGDQSEPIPYLEKPPRFGSIGEVATYHRMNEETGEYIDIKITFLKADRDFLLTRTPQNIRNVMEKELAQILLDDRKFKINAQEGTVKWAQLTGFSVDKNNNALYNAVHYLTGNSTIEIIKVQYSIENKLYNSQYQQLLQSIKFTGQ